MYKKIARALVGCKRHVVYIFLIEKWLCRRQEFPKEQDFISESLLLKIYYFFFLNYSFFLSQRNNTPNCIHENSFNEFLYTAIVIFGQVRNEIHTIIFWAQNLKGDTTDFYKSWPYKKKSLLWVHQPITGYSIKKNFNSNQPTSSYCCKSSAKL